MEFDVKVMLPIQKSKRKSVFQIYLACSSCHPWTESSWTRLWIAPPSGSRWRTSWQHHSHTQRSCRSPSISCCKLKKGKITRNPVKMKVIQVSYGRSDGTMMHHKYIINVVMNTDLSIRPPLLSKKSLSCTLSDTSDGMILGPTTIGETNLAGFWINRFGWDHGIEFTSSVSSLVSANSW